MKVIVEINYYEEVSSWTANLTFEKYAIGFSSDNLSDLLGTVKDSCLLHEKKMTAK